MTFNDNSKGDKTKFRLKLTTSKYESVNLKVNLKTDEQIISNNGHRNRKISPVGAEKLRLEGHVEQ